MDPSEYNVLLTAASLTSNQQKERMIQTLFESFAVDGAYIADSSVLSLYSCGLTSGVSVTSGDGVTSVVPVYEGKYELILYNVYTHNAYTSKPCTLYRNVQYMLSMLYNDAYVSFWYVVYCM